MKNSIKHSGIVEEVNIKNAHVRVRILQTSACASCKAASYCTSAESKEKLVDVYNVADAESIKQGEEVVVTASSAVAARALLWAFGGPFIVLVAVLFTLVLMGVSEMMSIVISISALIPYYLLLYLMRGHFQKTISFAIEGH